MSRHPCSRPLPSIDSPEVQHLSSNIDSRNAYLECLNCEKSIPEEKVRLVRLIGYLLIHAPNSEVRNAVAESINSYKDRDLIGFGEYFENYVIVPFKKCRPRSPVPPASVELSKREVEAEIFEAPETYEQAKKQALVRDNWRCVLTHTNHCTFDDEDIEDIPSLSGPPVSPPPDGPFFAFTDCAHIVPEATFFNVWSGQNDPNQRDYSSAVLAILRTLCDDICSFIGPKVHSLPNVMTLDPSCYKFFENLDLYLVPRGTERDTYNVGCCCFIGSGVHPPPRLRRVVTFTTHNAETHPVPSPDLLALHAICTKAAWLSGSTLYLNTVHEDLEEIEDLAINGDSDTLM